MELGGRGKGAGLGWVEPKKNRAPFVTFSASTSMARDIKNNEAIWARTQAWALCASRCCPGGLSEEAANKSIVRQACPLIGARSPLACQAEVGHRPRSPLSQQVNLALLF